MADIVHKINIQSPADKVYHSVATVEGLKSWWTAEIEGESREGGRLKVQVLGLSPVLEVLELIPGEIIKWKCVDGVEEWNQTILTFEMEEKDGNTGLLFAQSGWEDQTSFFAQCNTQWALFMLSLKDARETGQGRPWPKHIKIDG